MNPPYPISRLHILRSKKHVPGSIDPNDWPQEFKTTFYKTYPRLKKIDLPLSKAPPLDLFYALKNRSSKREFANQRSLSKQELSALLKFSCGTNRFNEGYNLALGRERHFRTTPSAGARYPIEIYPVLLINGPELKSGIYHYDILHHRLNVLRECFFTRQDVLKNFSIYPWVPAASVIFLLTAVFERSQKKYGERGYQYILIEIGHICQNFYLVAEALGFKCGSFSGNSAEIERVLDIDGNYEGYLHSLALGE